MFETLRGALTLPPLPPWEGMHVVIVHFPEALLMFAPIFVLLAAVLPKRCRWASWAALILLAGGTAGASLAVLSGGWAQNRANGSDAMYDVLTRHEELAILTRNVYLGITALYAVAIALPVIFKRLHVPRYLVSVNIVFLFLLAFGSLLLANTGHLGGRLVHEFGVKAIMDKSQLAKPDAEDASDKESADSETPDKSAAGTKAPEKNGAEKNLPRKGI